MQRLTDPSNLLPDPSKWLFCGIETRRRALLLRSELNAAALVMVAE